jgi:hypothetical protein
VDAHNVHGGDLYVVVFLQDVPGKQTRWNRHQS